MILKRVDDDDDEKGERGGGSMDRRMNII